MLLLTLLLSLQDPAALVERLRSNSIEERVQATRNLIQLGKGVLPVVEPLKSDPDPEVSRRAADIVRTLTNPPAPRTRLELEDLLTRSTSLHLNFMGCEPGQPLVMWGELWVKGDKFRGHIKGDLTIVSDGVKVRVERGTVAPLEFDATRGQGKDLLLGFVRVGACRSIRLKATGAQAGDLPVKDDTKPSPQVWRHLWKGPSGEPFAIDLVSEEKGLPLRRRVLVDGKQQIESEDYDLKLDEEPPAGTFALPGK